LGIKQARTRVTAPSVHLTSLTIAGEKKAKAKPAVAITVEPCKVDDFLKSAALLARTVRKELAAFKKKIVIASL